MAAFLFIPATAGAHASRRVDFANIAALFAEIEEPAAARRDTSLVARLLTFALVLLFAVGDMVLVARPDAAAMTPVAAVQAARPLTAL